MVINKKIMIIGIPKEIQEHESRVAISPEIVKKYLSLDHKIIIEKDSGANSLISDEKFRNSGAEIVDSSEEIYSQSDIIIKVNPPHCDVPVARAPQFAPGSKGTAIHSR